MKKPQPPGCGKDDHSGRAMPSLSAISSSFIPDFCACLTRSLICSALLLRGLRFFGVSTSFFLASNLAIFSLTAAILLSNSVTDAAFLFSNSKMESCWGARRPTRRGWGIPRFGHKKGRNFFRQQGFLSSGAKGLFHSPPVVWKQPGGELAIEGQQGFPLLGGDVQPPVVIKMVEDVFSGVEKINR